MDIIASEMGASERGQVKGGQVNGGQVNGGQVNGGIQVESRSTPKIHSLKSIQLQ